MLYGTPIPNKIYYLDLNPYNLKLGNLSFVKPKTKKPRQKEQSDKRIKLYLAGKMSGEKDLNCPLFDAWAKKLRAEGFFVFNPSENEGHIPPEQTIIGGSQRRQVMRRDLLFIIDKADGIAMIPGWEGSRGAVAEKAAADLIGLPIWYLDKK